MRAKRFTATHRNRIDSKGRVSVPAAFRKVIIAEEGADEAVVVFASPNGRYLEGATTVWHDEVADRFDANDSMDSETQEYFAVVMGDCHILDFSKDNGRIALPADLMEYAEIEDEVAFMGMGRMFQIWNPDSLAAYKAEARRRVGERKGRPKAESSTPGTSPTVTPPATPGGGP